MCGTMKGVSTSSTTKVVISTTNNTYQTLRIIFLSIPRPIVLIT